MHYKSIINSFLNKTGIPLTAFPILTGYSLSSIISFLSVPILFKESLNNNPLPLYTLTIFGLISVFDLALPRTTIFLFSKESANTKKAITLCLSALVSYSVISLIGFKLLLPSSFTEYDFNIILKISFVLSISGVLNILKSITDAIGKFYFSAIFRPLQAIIITTIPWLIVKNQSSKIIILITFLIIIIGCFTLFIHKKNKQKLMQRSKKEIKIIKQTSFKNAYINLLFSSLLIFSCNMGERFILPWIATPLILSSYLALQEYSSKITAVGTVILLAYYPKLSYICKTGNMKSIVNCLNKSVIASCFTSIIVSLMIYIIAWFKLNSIFTIFGYLPILLSLIGLVFNTINSQLLNFFEATYSFNYKTITLIFSTIISYILLFILLQLYPVGISIILFPFYKGIVELLFGTIMVRRKLCKFIA